MSGELNEGVIKELIRAWRYRVNKADSLLIEKNRSKDAADAADKAHRINEDEIHDFMVLLDAQAPGWDDCDCDVDKGVVCWSHYT